MNPFDSAIYNFLTQFQSPLFAMFLRVCSSFGSTLVIVTALLCIFLMYKDKRLFLHFTFLSAITVVLSSFIQNIVRRPKPTNILVLSFESGSKFSFPNTPALISFVFYGFIIYLIQKNVKNKKLKNITSLLLALIILFTSISKIYLGVCHATDIIGSFIIGLLILFLYIKFIFNMNEKNVNFFSKDKPTSNGNSSNKTESSKKEKIDKIKEKKHNRFKKKIENNKIE